MDTVRDFEDLLELLSQQGARYLIIGGSRSTVVRRPTGSVSTI